MPFYRAYDSVTVDHYYTPEVASVNDVVASGGWVLQGIAALVFVTPEESTVPFYRVANAAVGDNFYTISTTELDAALQNGYVLNPPPPDPVTYIYPTQICGSVPFYRLFSAAGQDNFYTISESERLDFIANGYVDVEIAGYVLALEAAQCT